MKNNKIVSAIIIIIILITLPISALAHSGRTDSQGGHKDNKNASGLGSYHFHCGGYPAHLHENGVCPYSASASSSSSSSKSTSTSTAPKEVYASSVKFTEAAKTLKIGDNTQLECSVYPDNAVNKDITWSSSDTNIATVTSTGAVTAVNVGTTSIIAKTSNDKSATFNLTVDEIKAESLVIENKPTDISKDGTISLQAQILPNNTTDTKVTWSSSDPSIIEVSETGELRALSPGTSTITATQKDTSDSFEITVNPVPESIGITTETSQLKTGEKITLEASILPDNAKDKSITWSIDNEELATIEDNILTAKKAGVVTVTATTVNGKTDSIEIEIESDNTGAGIATGAVLLGGGGYLAYRKRKKKNKE